MTEDALIYAAVIRQLVTKDHTFGGADPRFRSIYVIDGAVEGAGDPMTAMNRHRSDQPFSHDTQDGIRFLSTAAELPRVQFVPNSAAVVVGEGLGHVENHGVLISLGPIKGDGRRLKVGTRLWISGLAGQGLTYVLTSNDGVWEVSGTTGPRAIS
jgi:hypothetical protein